MGFRVRVEVRGRGRGRGRVRAKVRQAGWCRVAPLVEARAAHVNARAPAEGPEAGERAETVGDPNPTWRRGRT